MEQEQLIRKNIFLNKIRILVEIIMVILILVIGIYLFTNIELVKLLNQDICKICMEKTGATCFVI